MKPFKEPKTVEKSGKDKLRLFAISCDKMPVVLFYRCTNRGDALRMFVAGFSVDDYRKGTDCDPQRWVDDPTFTIRQVKTINDLLTLTDLAEFTISSEVGF